MNFPAYEIHKQLVVKRIKILGQVYFYSIAIALFYVSLYFPDCLLSFTPPFGFYLH